MAQQKKTKPTKDENISVHVSLGSGLGKVLESLAEKDKRTVSNMVRVLLYEALEARGEM